MATNYLNYFNTPASAAQATTQGTIGGQAVTLTQSDPYTQQEQNQLNAATSYLNGLGQSLFGTDLLSAPSFDASGNKVASTGASSSMWSDLFLRSVIIILGFIFVATGLSGFNKK